MLRFSVGQSTRLRVGTLIVLPNGVLEVGTAAAAIPASLTAEIIIRDIALNPTGDPNQYGTGLLSIDGSISLHGAIKTPTFVRTAIEPRAGHSTLSLERPVAGWQVGDRIFVPDTRQVPVDHWFNPGYALQIEERTVQGISGDGKTITLSSPLSFDHRGARDADGTPTLVGGTVRLLPHVGNLTRNVIVRSENPAGTRGHTLLTHRSNVSIQYAQFQDLGRTRATPLDAVSNHIGRYPLHIHQLWGPANPANTGYQFLVVGNAVNDSLKWPIAVHGSHYGLIRQNVVFGGSQLTGAGIAIEDGTETENRFEENFVANIRGSINPRESGPSISDGTTPGSAAECFWAAGFNNRFINNVAASCRNPVQQIVSGPGWKFIVPAAPYTAPTRAFAAQTWPIRARPSRSRPSSSRFSSSGETKSTALPPTGSPRGSSAPTVQHHAGNHARERDQRFPRVAHLRRSDLQLPGSPDDGGWPRLPHRSIGHALLALGIPMRRLPQREYHDS